MKDFLKTFGLGFLYFIALPFILLLLLFYGIYLFFVFIYKSVMAIILFFSGKKITKTLPEEIEADRILNEQIELSKNPPLVTQTPQPQGVTINNYTLNVDKDTLTKQNIQNIQNVDTIEQQNNIDNIEQQNNDLDITQFDN